MLVKMFGLSALRPLFLDAVMVITILRSMLLLLAIVGTFDMYKKSQTPSWSHWLPLFRRNGHTTISFVFPIN